MKRHSSMIRLVVLTCIFFLCFGSILWYMREQKLAETANSDTGPEQALTPMATLIPESASTPEQAVQPSLTPDATPTLKAQEATNVTSTPEAQETTDVTSTPEAQETTDVTPTPEATLTPEPTSADTVTLCLTGDLMCLAGQQYAAEREDGSHDFSGSFSLIQERLQSCDFAIGNLETVLTESIPYTTELKEVAEGCPNCNAPADYLAALKAAGFTTLVTCNNHSLDGGIAGINETLQHIEAYGFTHTGTYTSTAVEADAASTDRFLILEKNGIKIGLVAFTELINLRDSLPASELEQVINCYSEGFAAELIAAARSAGADYVIAYNHWGSENTPEVRSYQRAHAQALADAGADLIIGSHPHCLQELEILQTADGRTVPCYYSLGNLVSSMTRDINNDAILLTITLQRTEDTVILDKTIIEACHVFGYLNGSSHVIVPISYPVEKENHQTELQEAEQRILDALKLSR